MTPPRSESASTARRPRTTDATLSALTAKTATSETGTYTALNFGTFSAANTSYAQNVPAATTHLKLTPTANDAGATIKVGSGTILTAVTSGTESSAIELSAGTNAIKVEVTARDGATKQTYNLAIHRKDSDNVNPPASPFRPDADPRRAQTGRILDRRRRSRRAVNDAPTRYEIYWHESSAANPGWAGLHVFVVTGNPLPTAYEITQLTDGVQYTVYVRACNRGGCSPSPKADRHDRVPAAQLRHPERGQRHRFPRGVRGSQQRGGLWSS